MEEGGGGDRAPSDERVWKWKARRASTTAENATVCETHTGMRAMGVADRETTTGGRIVVREGHNESEHVSLVCPSRAVLWKNGLRPPETNKDRLPQLGVSCSGKQPREAYVIAANSERRPFPGCFFFLFSLFRQLSYAQRNRARQVNVPTVTSFSLSCH